MPRDLADTIRTALKTGEPSRLAEALEPWDRRELTVAGAEGLVAVLAEQTDAVPLVAEHNGDTFLYHLATLFQSDAEDAAIRVLRDRGVPELVRLFDAAAEVPGCNADPLAACAEVFALYAHKPGVERVARAVRRFPDEYPWEVVFGLFAQENHPHRKELVAHLSDPLPHGFAAVLLLELANALVREGRLPEHPFRTPDGRARLEAWLRDEDRDSTVRAEAEWAVRHCRGPVG